VSERGAAGSGRAAAALFLGASSMFATMYSTQAILPELSHGLDATPAQAGLSITVVVFAVAVFAWVHGPLSDRIGRARVMVGSAALLVIPTALVAVASSLPVFLALRAAQGALMPGLLVVAVPYVSERFRGPAVGAAMGAYTASLTFGGLVGRVGTALIADWVGWRWALGSLVVPVILGALAMWAWLPRDVPQPVRRPLGEAIADHVHNRMLVTNAVVAAATFFGYVGLFTYASYRLTSPAIGLTIGESGLVYGVWIVGAAVPLVGHLAHRAGPARLLPFLTALAIAGALLTLVASLPVLILGLAMTAFAMFSIVTTCQILLPRLVDHHRGTATSLHLTIYYLAGGAGAYLPGLRLSAGWPAVVEVCIGAFVVGTGAALLLRARVGRGVALGTVAE